MELLLERMPRERYTPGALYIDGQFFCYTLEDQDRKLESGGRKVYGETCIPRGKYPVVLDFSARFKRLMPHVLGVPQFDGIRIHNGRTTEHTHGCVLVGYEKFDDQLLKSKEAFEALMSIMEGLNKYEKISLEVK